MFRKLISCCVLLTLLLTAATSDARGDLVVNVTESGSDVVVNGSGTIDLNGLTFFAGVQTGQANIRPDQGFYIGPVVSTAIDFYTGARTGPVNFGTGTDTMFASTGSGDICGFFIDGAIAVPDGYVTGTALSGSSTFTNHSLATLGIAPGTYIWTIGANTITLNAVTSVSVIPDSVTVTRGLYVSGSIVELGSSDNDDLSIQRGLSDTQSRTEFEVVGISPTATPASLEVTLEGAVFARSTVVQTIELYDYVAAAWELVDTRNSTNIIDSTANASATGDLSRFVDPGTLSMEARIHFRSLSPRQRFASNTDLFMWMIE